MKNISNLLLMFILIGLVSSCSDDPVDPIVTESKYQNGFFVVNEGNFSDGYGSLTFYNTEKKLTYAEAYQAENNGDNLGGVAQSMNIIDGNAYVVANNSGKVVIMDSDSLKHMSEISGLNQPRYIIEGAGNNLYVSEWGDGFTGAVRVVDKTNNTITSTIDLGNGPEHMLYKDDKLYVAKSGGYGLDSVVVVIDGMTNDVSSTINVGHNPVDVIEGADNALWVLCKGHSDWADPTNNTSGKLVKIVNDAVDITFDVPNGSNDLVINEAKDKLYFLTSTNVYVQSVDSTSFSEEVFYEGNFYSLDLNKKNGNFFLGNAKDFASNGEVNVLDDKGDILNTIVSGVTPGSFWFVD